jgi:hypothetical protein
MKRNINGFRLTKNGKPILKECGDILLDSYQGNSFKLNGEYYFYSRMYQGKNLYKK